MRHVNLKQFRKNRKLTQNEVAKSLNIVQSVISKYENGIELSSSVLKKLIDCYPDIIDYPLEQDQDKGTPRLIGNIIHIPPIAERGLYDGTFAGVLQNEVEAWDLPRLKGLCYSFEVKTRCMHKTLAAGEFVVTSREPIRSYNDLILGQMYVFQLVSFIDIMRFSGHLSDTSMRVSCDNPEIEDKKVTHSEIINIFAVRRIISHNVN